MADAKTHAGSFATRLAAAKGMVFDLDGTLVLGDKNVGGHRVLPGAIEFLAQLREWQLPFQILTNGTIHTPPSYAQKMRAIGLDIRDDEMMTPSTAATDYFVAKGIRRVLVLGGVGVWQPLADAGIEVVESSKGDADVDAVYVGWFREFTMPDLEIAAQAIWKGALLTTASNVPFFATAGGRSIGSSFAINVMLTALTGKKTRVLGKPARQALLSAARRMQLGARDLRGIVVVGDDPQLETAMANAAGAISVAVTTGLSSKAMLAKLPLRQRPHRIVANVQELLTQMQKQRRGRTGRRPGKGRPGKGRPP
ncbi:MAG: HAD hydrolase-like protein [Pseudomonadota bacterium]